jgi:protein SCO1
MNGELPAWVSQLPAVNAGLNSVATLLLISGYVAIRRRQKSLHKTLMLTAFATSVVFLGCYLAYHWGLHHYTGESGKKFLGVGWIRPVYFTILISHVVLAAAVPVLALMTIARGLKQQWDAHRRIARITFPIWLYVSVTGVIIYAMLYHWPVAAGPAMSTATSM